MKNDEDLDPGKKSKKKPSYSAEKSPKGYGILAEPLVASAPPKSNRRVSETNELASKPGKMMAHSVVPASSEKPEHLLTNYERMEISRRGISKNGLEQLKTRINFDYNNLAKVLATTRVTLLNKKGIELFSPSLSEKILSLAEVYAYGYEVFENEENFNNWIITDNKALGGRAPLDFLDNQFGREEIKNLIGRIDHGIYS